MSSHWCHRCNRFVRAWRQHGITTCPDCDSGFVEEIEHPNRFLTGEGRRRRFPSAAAMYMIGNRTGSDQNSRSSRRRNCINTGGNRSPFNPVIMFRGEGSSSRDRGFELFYDDGAGSGLRPLPQRMSEVLLGSGFDRVMEQLSHMEANGSVGRHGQNPRPASISAVESLPAIEINETHMATESHCAVCKEPFELGIAAKEMPCKHIYHHECILPWLAIRNSCPVCRHELPSEEANGRLEQINEEENVGLTVWRLPGGGFAVGRYGGGRRGEVPLVYTEVDGGFNFNSVVGEPRRVSWSVSSSRGRGSGGSLRRMFHSLFACFRSGSVVGPHSSVSIREHSRTMRSASAIATTSLYNVDPSPRSRRTWSMDVNSGTRPW
ncbi:E3 ubiquitin-protein ligase RDUF2-like [Abrus precatorius]|uniref:RING-type E3 ubiquitin transferase n=1 Tax=Abrus precatorius TaxID=3816 RepID=A0A8B8JR45_ABRPR|nr:E3 ubiquitin-protein ligase RDUF2-like [Abrus precatorius]